MSNETDGIFTDEYQIALVAAVSLTCILSTVGSLAIIISFIAFRELRTTMRYLLFNLSVADLIVAVTNLAGALYSLKYLKKGEAERPENDPICIAQAAIGLAGVDASILWTIILIAYIYIFLAWCRPRPTANYIVLGIVTFISWAIPIILVIVFVIEDYFGYEGGYSPAFCTIDTENKTQIWRGFIGYELFLYFSFLVLPIFSIVFMLHLCYIVSIV